METYTDFRKDILDAIAMKPGIELYELQYDLGYPRKRFGNVPSTNPVNRELVAMRGEIEVNESTSGFGDPRFYSK